jgi:AraC family transcriptional regulator, regulatory protein of adaptative response / methylated-DNA-[protein]-cysteine methyltransferase
MLQGMNQFMLSDDEMYKALLARNSEYDGLFFVGVRTTGIFCRCTCTARKPLRQNVRFFGTARDALMAGFRPCKRCAPLEVCGGMPPWLEQVVSAAERDLQRRWADEDIRRQGTDPVRVRRWFQKHHGITFHGFLRARRLSAALAQLSVGEDFTRVALDAGYESVSGFREAFQNWFGAPPGAELKRRRRLMVNRIFSPLGPMVAAADDESLFLLEFADRRMLPSQLSRLAKRLACAFVPGENEILRQTEGEIAEYFGGRRRGFTVPLSYPGTEFQRSVWQQLRRIPYGETSTYEQIARCVKNPHAVRAVGRANGDNRLAIILPCHRVVRSDGTLSGYGGGVRRKEWLLTHERAVAAAPVTS